mmetsp:Transcript_20612/g.54666  ORF Transcript_20612/g.54666 Transcript_20612/m.54666 type:complete len:389 (+) Transcript_20612:101-1267(+)
MDIQHSACVGLREAGIPRTGRGLAGHFVDQLHHSDGLSWLRRRGRFVKDWHAEHAPGTIPRLLVHFSVEAAVLVAIWDNKVSLLGEGGSHQSRGCRDADVCHFTHLRHEPRPQRIRRRVVDPDGRAICPEGGRQSCLKISKDYWKLEREHLGLLGDLTHVGRHGPDDRRRKLGLQALVHSQERLQLGAALPLEKLHALVRYQRAAASAGDEAVLGLHELRSADEGAGLQHRDGLAEARNVALGDEPHGPPHDQVQAVARGHRRVGDFPAKGYRSPLRALGSDRHEGGQLHPCWLEHAGERHGGVLVQVLDVVLADLPPDVAHAFAQEEDQGDQVADVDLVADPRAGRTRYQETVELVTDGAQSDDQAGQADQEFGKVRQALSPVPECR